MTPSMLSSPMPKASLQMRRKTAISLSETCPSARIMRNSRSSSADSTGSSATLRTPGSPSKRSRIWAINPLAMDTPVSESCRDMPAS